MKMIDGSMKFSSSSGCFPVSRLTAIALAAATALACWTTLVTTAQEPSGARALVSQGMTVDGRIEGSVQQLNSEDTTINDGATITGLLLTPGSPGVRQNDSSTVGTVTQGNGSEQPGGYFITLNGNSHLGQLVKRTDPVAAPTVAAPAGAAGTRDVTLSESDQDAGDFATLRDLTLNGGGVVAVPAGTYRSFVANNGGGFVLGVSGSSQPAVYNLNSLTLNDGSQLQIVGPVVLTIASGVTLSGPSGTESHPQWLSLKVAGGDVTLNAGAAFLGVITAPTSTVTINRNGSLKGNVLCNRLAVNVGGLLRVID